MESQAIMAAKASVRPEDLWDKPLILSHDTNPTGKQFRWLKRDISQLNIVATYDLLYNAAQFAKRGFGYVLALDGIIDVTGQTELCFRPLSPALEAALYVVWKKYQVQSKAAKAFLGQLVREIDGKG